MKVVSKTDFDKTLNLPKKTIDTEDEIVKKDSFFIESFRDGSKFNKANEKNLANKSRVNISEIPMPISDKIPPTIIINKVLKDVIARYSILKGNYINHSVGFFHTDEMLKQIKEEKKITNDENTDNDNKDTKDAKINFSLKKKTNSAQLAKQKMPDFSHVRKEFGIVEKNKANLENNIRKQIYEISNLGAMINYSKYNYSTLKLDVTNKMLEKFSTLYSNGYIYSQKKPVHWCTNCGKSAPQKDVKYRKSKVKNTYFLCKIKNDNENLANILDLKNTFLVCATLRPWILLNTNKLIVAKDSKFSVVKVEETNNTKTYYIIESSHVKHVMEDAFYIKYEVVTEFDSKLLNGVIVSNPLKIEKSIQIYEVDKKYASIDNRNTTGINLIGNSDSYLDYLINKDLNITNNLNCVIDAKGNFNNFIPDYKGKNYKDVNEEVISLLKKEKMLFLDTNIVITIPRCKICNHEITYRYLNKWYIRRDENIKNDLKIAFEELEKRITYNEENNLSTIKKGLSKILNTHDLSISNERKSSVPVPAFYCANCGNEIISSLTIDICKSILKEKGIDTWNKMTPEEILQGQVKCEKCDCDFLFKDDNSLNDWFKLLTIPMFNVSIEKKETEKVNNDAIIKNYCIETRMDFFNKLKVISFDIDAINKINKINKVMIHTKVKENTKTIANPLFLSNADTELSSNLITTNLGIIDIVKKYGIDVLRLWAVYRSDNPSIKLTEGDIVNVKTSYLQFRKTLKYILSNLYDFNPTKDSIKVQERDDLDVYIYSKMQQLEAILDIKYNELNFPAIYKTLYKFCVEILQNNYFEAIKYKLYITPKNGFYRRSVQSNLYDLVGIFVTYLQPILPLLFEECWPYIYHNSPEEERNILLFRDSNNLEKFELTEEQKNWHKIFILRKKIIPFINKACNEGIIKNSLEARVIITCSEFDYNFIKENYYDIIRTLNVSVIVFKTGQTLNIEVKKALGVECHKCKNYSTSIGINYKYRHLCKYCANIEEMIATNTVSNKKPQKDIYIDFEHINDDEEKAKTDIDIPPPPKFDTLNLENVDFDDRLGDKMDEEKISTIKELNSNITNNTKNTTNTVNNIVNVNDSDTNETQIPQYHFETEFEEIEEPDLNNANLDDKTEKISNNTNVSSITQEKITNLSNHEFDDRLGDKMDEDKVNKIKELNKKVIEIKAETPSEIKNETKETNEVKVESANSKEKFNNTQNKDVDNVDNKSTEFLDNVDKKEKSNNGLFASMLKNKKEEKEQTVKEDLTDKETNTNANNTVDDITKNSSSSIDSSSVLQEKITNLSNHEFDDRLGDKMDEDKVNKIKELNKKVIEVKAETPIESKNETKEANKVKVESADSKDKFNDIQNKDVENTNNNSSGFWDDMDKKEKPNNSFFGSMFKTKKKEKVTTVKEDLTSNETNTNTNIKNESPIDTPKLDNKLKNTLNEKNNTDKIIKKETNKSEEKETKDLKENISSTNSSIKESNNSTSDDSNLSKFEDSFRD